jgi:hypothetical protein
MLGSSYITDNNFLSGLIGGPGLYGFGQGGSGQAGVFGTFYLAGGGGGGAGGPSFAYILRGTLGNTLTAWPPNMGHGGHLGFAGSSGRCLVMWTE